jgi:hypothetical protein
MQWDKKGVRSFKRYATCEESYADFKRIWAKSYKTFPTLKAAQVYSGNDRAHIWLANVKSKYNEF